MHLLAHLEPLWKNGWSCIVFRQTRNVSKVVSYVRRSCFEFKTNFRKVTLIISRHINFMENDIKESQ